MRVYTTREKNQKKEWNTFRLDGDFDAYTYIKSYMAQRKGQLIRMADYAIDPLKAESKALRIADYQTDQPGRVISGLAKIGEYGVTGDIVDTHKDSTAYSKRKQDADMPPYYFCFHVPDGASRIIVLIQKSGSSSPKAVLEKDLKKYLSEFDIVCEFKSLSHRQLFDQYLRGGAVTELTLKSKKMLKDSRSLAAKSRVAGKAIETGTVIEIRLVETDGFTRFLNNGLRGILNHKNNGSDLVEIHGLEDYDDLLVKVDFNGRPRSFNVSKPDSTSYSWDITRRVSVSNSTGHPTYESIHDCAQDYMKDLIAINH